MSFKPVQKYINNQKHTIPMNFKGTQAHAHTHRRAHKQGYKQDYRVCPISTRELRMPALFLLVPSLVPAQSSHPITAVRARLCIDLQIICSFTITCKPRITIVLVCFVVVFFSTCSHCYPPNRNGCPVGDPNGDK